MTPQSPANAAPMQGPAVTVEQIDLAMTVFYRILRSQLPKGQTWLTLDDPENAAHVVVEWYPLGDKHAVGVPIVRCRVDPFDLLRDPADAATRIATAMRAEHTGVVTAVTVESQAF